MKSFKEYISEKIYDYYNNDSIKFKAVKNKLKTLDIITIYRATNSKNEDLKSGQYWDLSPEGDEFKSPFFSFNRQGINDFILNRQKGEVVTDTRDIDVVYRITLMYRPKYFKFAHVGSGNFIISKMPKIPLGNVKKLKLNKEGLLE